VRKVAGGVTTSYTYDGMNILVEKRTEGESTTTKTFIHGPGIDEPLGVRDEAGTVTYLHADGRSVSTPMRHSGSAFRE
jgi:YD repeat-containing protein